MQSIRFNTPPQRVSPPFECDEAMNEAARPTTGKVRLTAREIECLQWLARGCYDAQIAGHLGVSHSTIRLHLKNARVKLHARTREQALVIAVQLRLIVP